MSIRQATDPVPLADALRELVLGHVDERARDLERIKQAWREGFLSGHETGWAGGYAQAEADMEQAWADVVKPFTRDLVRNHGLQGRRWNVRGEPRTRATFGDPHPDDYPGNGAA